MKKLVLVIVGMIIVAGSVQAQGRPRFRNPQNEQRYYSALRDAQYYRSEQARYEAQAQSLQRSDRFFRPIRRASDAGFNYASRGLGPVYGPVVRYGYRNGMRYIRRGQR